MSQDLLVRRLPFGKLVAAMRKWKADATFQVFFSLQIFGSGVDPFRFEDERVNFKLIII